MKIILTGYVLMQLFSIAIHVFLYYYLTTSNDKDWKVIYFIVKYIQFGMNQGCYIIAYFLMFIMKNIQISLNPNNSIEGMIQKIKRQNQKDKAFIIFFTLCNIIILLVFLPELVIIIARMMLFIPNLYMIIVFLRMGIYFVDLIGKAGQINAKVALPFIIVLFSICLIDTFKDYLFIPLTMIFQM